MRIIGGSAGGTADNTSPQIVAWSDGTNIDRPTDILVDGVLFHDVHLKTEDGHVECLQSTDAVRLTIRNSRFARCDVFNVRVDKRWSDAPEDVLIESNVFDQTGSAVGGTVYYGLGVGSGDGVVIREQLRCHALAGPAPDSVAKDIELVGDAMPGGGCDDRVTYRHNLWQGGRVWPDRPRRRPALRRPAGRRPAAAPRLSRARRGRSGVGREGALWRR